MSKVRFQHLQMEEWTVNNSLELKRNSITGWFLWLFQRIYTLRNIDFVFVQWLLHCFIVHSFSLLTTTNLRGCTSKTLCRFQQGKFELSEEKCEPKINEMIQIQWRFDWPWLTELCGHKYKGPDAPSWQRTSGDEGWLGQKKLHLNAPQQLRPTGN